MENTFLRNELKFLISKADAEILRSRFDILLEADKNEIASNGYFIRSIYYDDLSFSSYFDKLSGVPERIKYRIRFYNLSDDYICIEKKEKESDKIKKISCRITRNQLDKIMNSELSGFENAGGLLSEFISKIKYDAFSPAAIVDYQRKTYVSPFSDIRITFDNDLFAAPFRASEVFDISGCRIPVSESGEVILEVKFNEFLLPVISDALRDIPSVRIANSKYCRCCEALYWSMK